MKTISILLVKYHDPISFILHHIARHGYTHASLGLDEETAHFYSFNLKGFCIETAEKHRRRGLHTSVCYQLEVSDEHYEAIRARIDLFQAQRADYHYSRLGVLFAILGIPLVRKKKYMCSEFVAELLISSGTLPLRKRAGAYLPNQLCRELECFPTLAGVSYTMLE